MGRTKMKPKDYEAQEKLEAVTQILQEVAINGYDGTAQELAQEMFGIKDGEDNGRGTL